MKKSKAIPVARKAYVLHNKPTKDNLFIKPDHNVSSSILLS